MKDESKTKRQLIGELAELRQRLSLLTRQLAEARGRVDELEPQVHDDAVRQQMEEALRASVEQWYTAFDVMSDAICLMDSEGKIGRCNRAMVALLDRPLSEILGHHCWQVVHGMSEPVDGCPLVRMRESLSRESTTMPLGDRWFEVSVDPVLVADEQSFAAIHVMRDITEQKVVEKALQESEQRFRVLFEESPIAYQSLDRDGRLIEVNKAWLDLLGHNTKEEVIGKPFGEFIAPHLSDSFVERFSRFKGEGEAHDVRWEVVRKNGAHLIVSLDGTAYLDPRGSFRTHCVMRDITQIVHAEEERARAEADLKESEERYRSLFENASLGIGYYTTDGRVIAYNCAAAAHLNGNPEDFTGRTLPDIFGEEAGTVYAERIRRALSSPGPLTFEDRVSLPVGDKWFVSTYNRIADASGMFVGIQIISNDITERKHSEEALQDSEARYRGLVEGLPDIVWSFSDTRGTVYASSRVETVLGYSPDHLYRNPWLWNRSIHPDDRDRIAQAIAEFAAGQDLDVEYRIKDASGNWRWLHDRSIGRRVEGDETIIEGISTDITDRVGAEEALRKSTPISWPSWKSQRI